MFSNFLLTFLTIIDISDINSQHGTIADRIKLCWKMGRPWEKIFFKLVKLRRKVTTTRLDLVNWRVLSENLKAFYFLTLTFLLKKFDPCGHKFLLQMYSAGSNFANYCFDIWTHFYFCCIQSSEHVILASHLLLFTVSLQSSVIII